MKNADLLIAVNTVWVVLAAVLVCQAVLVLTLRLPKEPGQTVDRAKPA